MSKKTLVSILVLALVLLAAASIASADRAVVLNHPDGPYCEFATDSGTYQGPATVVLVDGTLQGKLNIQCNASLITGSPVAAEKIRDFAFGFPPLGYLLCNIQLTPSGNGNVSCANQYLQPYP